jgi:tetratricopeptide (TPR) repeat protein
MAYVNLGLANEKDKGDMQKAYEDFKKASEIDSTYALAWHNMGAIQLSKNSYDTAVQYLNRAISLNPNYENSYGARGETRFKMGDYKGAIEDYNKFILYFQGIPTFILPGDRQNII